MLVTDHDLLGRIAARDRAAFAEFYDRYAARVLGLIVRVLRNRTDAEDVLQEAFLQVWNQAGRFDPARAAPDVWVLLIARSRAVDRLRKRTVTVTDEVPDPARPTTRATGWHGGRRRTGCGRALQHLPAEQEKVICLAFFHGLTHEQIAARLTLPLGTVKTRIRLGMTRLRDRFAGPAAVGAAT